MRYLFRYILLIACSCGLSLCVSAQGKPRPLPDSVMKQVNAVVPELRDSVLYTLGAGYYKTYTLQGYNMALDCYLAMLEYSRKYKHTEYIIYSYFLLGSVYDAIKNIDGAVRYYTRYYYSIIRDPVSYPPIITSRAAFNLASIYAHIKKADSSMKYARIMASFADGLDTNNKDMYMVKYHIYLQLANIMNNLGDDDQFLYYYEKIPRYVRFTDNNDLAFIRIAAISRSKYLSLKGKGRSQELIAPLLKELVATNDSLDVLRNIYQRLIENKRYEEAALYHDMILDQLDRSSKNVYNDIQYKLIRAENDQKEWNNQLLKIEQKRLTQRNQLMYVICSILAIGFIASFYAYRKFSQQNTKLNEQNRQIKEQSERIQVLLREIHHRVKNNLQIISSLIDLQQMNSGTINVLWLREIQSKMRTIALAHQMIYEQQQIATISLQAYFEHMTGDVLSTLTGASNVTRRVDMGELQLGLDELVPLALIINELLINTVKHAMPRQPDCDILLSGGVADGKMTISYSDNGPGLATHIDIAKATSMGLRLIRKLAAQLDATMKMDNIPGEKLGYSFIWSEKM